MHREPPFLALLAPLLALGCWLLFPSWGVWIDRKFAGVARRVGTSGPLVYAAIFVGVTLLCMGVAAVRGIPLPVIHDEVSNLLLADTLAQGRLANPTHPHWEFFEGFHVVHQPAYVSKYPPAPAAFLALGQVVLGHPIWGVWIASALSSVALFWMLKQWIPSRWAMLGVLLFTFQIAAGSYFGNSYWGGSIAIVGGSLVFGAARALVVRGAAKDGLLLGLGLVLLANSRPYEGFVAAMAAGVYWLVAWRGRRRSEGAAPAVYRWVGACGLVLALGGSFMLVYNRATTGHYFKMPYMLHDEMYHIAPLFIFQGTRDVPEYRYEIMRQYHDRELENYVSQRSPVEFLNMAARTANHIRRFYMGNVLSVISFVFLLYPPISLLRSNVFIAAILSLSAGGIASLLANWFFPHYFAPFGCLVVLLSVLFVRHLRVWRVRERTSGRSLAAWLAVVAIAVGFLYTPGYSATGWTGWSQRRLAAAESLRARGGRHLVFVRYEPEHLRALFARDRYWVHEDWVSNGATIDDADVIWARDRGDRLNRKLVDYYPERDSWLIVHPRANLAARPIPYQPHRSSGCKNKSCPNLPWGD